MGAVYQGFPPDGGALVALKVLRADYDNDPNFQQRFVREIRLMEALQHQHIVPILGYGSYAGGLYLVMKLITGPSLATLMTRQALTPLEMWHIFNPAAQALAYAHERGILHRDIKPDNLFLERQAEGGWHVYLGDFGLGKNPQADADLTLKGTSVGTTEYMSPEAVLGDDLTHLGDVYSLAAVVYEMLLGVLPVRVPPGRKMQATHVLQPTPLPTALNPAFPPVLEKALLHGLANPPEERCQSVAEFRERVYQALKQMSEAQRSAVYWVRD